MIGKRTLYSFVQFLGLQSSMDLTLLLEKYGVQNSVLSQHQLLYELKDILCDLDPNTLMQVLREIIATSGDLRARVTPKYSFDERMSDLKQCLLLDGYDIRGKKLVSLDPEIAGAAPLEDDLVVTLQNSGLPRAHDIIAMVKVSADMFRSTPPDYNASLTNARVALETLGTDVASCIVARQQLSSYDLSSWGKVLAFLKTQSEITTEEEIGLAGVYRFLSPGAHRPVGIPEEQMTRLGRSFALNMCWFLLKNLLHSAKVIPSS